MPELFGVLYRDASILKSQDEAPYSVLSLEPGRGEDVTGGGEVGGGVGLGLEADGWIVGLQFLTGSAEPDCLSPGVWDFLKRCDKWFTTARRTESRE